MVDRKPVYHSYDVIADWFANVRRADLSYERHHLEAFISHLPSMAKVLDLGCGNGLPIAAFLLKQGFTVTAIDASEKMLKKARINIPSAKILQIDMRALHLDESFHGILMWHSSFHLSQDEQVALLKKVSRHLHRDAVLMFTSGTDNGEAWGDNNGENLYHASLSASEYRSLLEELGFVILSHTVEDPRAGGATVWLAKFHPSDMKPT